MGRCADCGVELLGRRNLRCDCLPGGGMLALTLYQPWATLATTLMPSGQAIKTVEIRTHRRWKLKGKRLAIHAGKKWDKEGSAIAVRYLDKLGFPEEEIAALLVRAREVHGHVLGTVHCRDVRGMGPDDAAFALCDWDHELYAYVLDELIPLDIPVPATGRQGVWHWKRQDSPPRRQDRQGRLL